MQDIDYRNFVQNYHDNRLLPNRHCYIMNMDRVEKAIGIAGGCMASFAEACGKYAGAYQSPAIIFHGDGAPISFAGLTNEKDYNECMLAHTQPFNAFRGTDRSLRWVKFLLSDISPWRALHEHMVPLEPEWINNAGFIFNTTGDKLPSRLAYNFALAVRFPWELSRCYELCDRLWSAGIEPVTAVYIAMNFCLSNKAKDLSGPYDVRYPWSFLEESGLEAAGRFILSKPADVACATLSNVANVTTLWKLKEDQEKSAQVMKDLINDDKLSLDKILWTLTETVERQKEFIK